jgi:hypothetical protein
MLNRRKVYLPNHFNSTVFGCIDKILTVDKYIIVSKIQNELALFRSHRDSSVLIFASINEYNNLAKYKVNFQTLIVSYSSVAMSKFLDKKKLYRGKVVSLFDWLDSQQKHFISYPSPLLRSRN